jgi:hypothetical protein
MIKAILVLMTISFPLFAKNKKQVVKDLPLQSVEYVSTEYLHVHQNNSYYSNTLTTIPCGQPVNILKSAQSGAKTGMKYVQVGPYPGYVKEKYLSATRVICLEKEYPRFFDLVSAEISEIYFWGKLKDMMIQGKSKVK